jgi:hypothetical protein
MAGFENDVMFAKNADFTQADNQSPTESNGLATNGQLWIGSTAVNAGGTHINVGNITSPNNSISIGYASPNITLQVAGGSTSVLTLTGNSGVATPSAGNINVVTANTTIKFVGSGATLTQDFGLTNLLLGVSGSTITSGIANTSLGLNALAAVTQGTSNVAIGQTALNALTQGTTNVSIGAVSLAVNQTSNSNVAIGHHSMDSLLSGSGTNTAVGYFSLDNITTGSFNLALGQLAGTSYITSDSSNIVLMNSGTLGESNTIRIGTQGSGSGQQNRAFMAGIIGVTNSNPQLVTINSSTGQLGVTTSSELLWNVVSTNQTGATSNGYIFVSPGGALTISLPTTSSVGDEFSVVLDGATSWQITQAAGQQIRLASSTTTLGATGSLTSTAQGNAVTLVCRVANTTWTAISVIGNITVA